MSCNISYKNFVDAKIGQIPQSFLSNHWIHLQACQVQPSIGVLRNPNLLRKHLQINGAISVDANCVVFLFELYVLPLSLTAKGSQVKFSFTTRLHIYNLQSPKTKLKLKPTDNFFCYGFDLGRSQASASSLFLGIAFHLHRDVKTKGLDLCVERGVVICIYLCLLFHSHNACIDTTGLS